MIPNTKILVNSNPGSSFVFSASGGRDKEKKLKPAEKIAIGSEGGAERQISQSGFSSKKVRLPAAGRDFNQKVPPVRK